ncbi:hypothetical protein ACFL03_12075 [Thermodesulfobacteriota bacterium]
MIGPTTLTALENVLFEDSQGEAAVENYSLTVSRKGLKQLVRHEISSAAYYRKFLSHPIWPGGAPASPSASVTIWDRTARRRFVKIGLAS